MSGDCFPLRMVRSLPLESCVATQPSPCSFCQWPYTSAVPAALPLQQVSEAAAPQTDYISADGGNPYGPVENVLQGLTGPASLPNPGVTNSHVQLPELGPAAGPVQLGFHTTEQFVSLESSLCPSVAKTFMSAANV
jgi:hypothetical protein